MDDDFDPGLDDDDELIEVEADNEEIDEGDDDVVEVKSQADYTRMAQDIAAKRKAAASEIAYLEGLRKQAADDEDAGLEPEERLSKELQQLRADLDLQRQIAAFEKAVVAEVSKLNKAGTAFEAEPTEVAEWMQANGVTSPVTAVKFMSKERSSGKAAKTAAASEAKRKLGVVGASSARAEESTPRPTSIRESFALAKKGVRID